MLLTLGLSFIILILVGVPISFCLGISGLAALICKGLPVITLARKMYAGLDAYVLLAVPLFILAAEIMNSSGITKRLIDFSELLVGRIRGGLAHTNILASMLFAGISGAALADASGLGAIEIDMMKKAGYEEDFSAAITGASAIIGPIIPPSIIMVIYAVTSANVSVIGLFSAGIIPGLLMGLVLMCVVAVIAKRRQYPKRTFHFSFREGVVIIGDSIIAMIMPLIIIGGILLGIFTATEAAAVAVFYAFLVGIFVTRSLTLKMLPEIIFKTMITTSIVFMIISCAQVWAYVVTVAHAPEIVGNAIMKISDSPYVFLALCNIFFLILGSLIDASAAIIIAVPVFAPIAISMGIDPLHFAIIVTVNLSIGCITPPVGTSLYAVASVAKIPVERLVKAITPFLISEIFVLFIITYVPIVSLAFPQFLGFR
jgi:C4-dicarboxylate transporter DctM subunit